MKTARFNINKFGVPLLHFESEVHITDELDENITVIIKSGFGNIEPTLKISAEILNILNNGNRTK